MNTWFFKLEGKSNRNAEISYPFGFYVSCFISTDDGIQSTKNTILNDLKADGYTVVKFEHFGRYEDFYWDEMAIQKEFDKLARKARSNPNTIHYSSFHTWGKE